MKSKIKIAWLCALALGWAFNGTAALPSDWRHEQHFEVAAPGFVKFSLPPETLDAARPVLEDLRVHDSAGNEIPFFIERTEPSIKTSHAPDRFQVSLNRTTTVITLETGVAQPLEGISLETPAAHFIKAVRVEGSADSLAWKSLADGQPVFRQHYGASQLRVGIPPGFWRWIRLTVDDSRTPPVPFTGARVHAILPESTPLEQQPATITERNENPGETRLTLNLGAANLDIATVQLESVDPLFTRLVKMTVPLVSENGIVEQTVGQGTVYRVAMEGWPASENLSLPLESRLSTRELQLIIQNQDSPPLSVTAVRLARRSVHLVFMARTPGLHYLLTGNKSCPAPRYDLASLGGHLKNVAVTPVKISPPANNPDFRTTEALAGIELGGTALDVTDWKFRKRIKNIDGVGQVELDLEVISHTESDFSDLRVMRGGNQIPYLVQRTSISRSIKPSVTRTNDAQHPQLSRWIIKLPKPNLTLTRLSCESRTPLFRRDVTLYEELHDERGDKYRRPLAEASWVQTPDGKSREFVLMPDQRIYGDTLILETENGDNPPVELEKFSVFYPATRILFRSKPETELFLYYGNPHVASPRYDLDLIAGQLLAADKSVTTLSAEEQLKPGSWHENREPGKGGALLWGILALVVVALLVIVARLLPKNPPTAPGGPAS